MAFIKCEVPKEVKERFQATAKALGKKEAEILRIAVKDYMRIFKK